MMVWECTLLNFLLVRYVRVGEGFVCCQTGSTIPMIAKGEERRGEERRGEERRGEERGGGEGRIVEASQTT